MLRLRPLLVSLVTLCLLGGCKSGPEPADDPAASSEANEENLAKFRFGWSSDSSLEADVRRKFRKPGGRERSYRAGYRVDVEERDGGLRVLPKASMEVGKTGTNEVTAADAIAAASAVAMPAIDVTSEGAFESVSGVDRARKDFVKVVRKLNGGSLGKRQRRALKPLLGREYMKSRARQYWDLLVGLWAGSQVPIGETQEVKASDSFQFPVVGRREVEMELEFTVAERVTCSSRPKASGSDPACVRIEMKSRPDVRKMTDAMQKWVDRFAAQKAKRRGMKKPPDLTVSNVFVRNDVVLVTRPATLRPVQLTEKRTVRMTLEGPDGREKSYKLVDEVRTRFEGT